jgi:thioester reductase-like protein
MTLGTALITGFPGFIACRLVRRMVQEKQYEAIHLLVERRFIFRAQKWCLEMEQQCPNFAGRWRIVEGDICRPYLGIDENLRAEVCDPVTQIWHLAAVYDLAVGQSMAYRVNVTGTDNVLDLAGNIDGLDRLFYVSTCYVAGDRTGRIYEDELDCGQDFKNHYESTKFWAELRVQARRPDLPITIFRPAIVVGDSTTGEINKADGPYHMLRLLQLWPRWLPALHLGPSKTPFNVVPVDFVTRAMLTLSSIKESSGRVFQLADPTPRTARDLLNLSVAALQRAPAIATLPGRVASLALNWSPVRDALHIPPQSLAYLDHDAHFDVSNTAELLEDTLVCPEIESYWPRVVGFARAHPEIYAT